MSSSFTITGDNWQGVAEMNELCIGVNERMIASGHAPTDYPTDGLSHDFYTPNLITYAGKIYRCIEDHTTIAFDASKWLEMKVSAGSDIQGIWYLGTHKLVWWGWAYLQFNIETMCSGFVKEIYVDEYNPSPVDPRDRHIEVWNFPKLRASVHADDSSLFSDPSQPDGVALDWTRKRRSGAVVTTLYGPMIGGDFISSIAIAEIRACLQKLNITFKDHQNDWYPSDTQPNATSSTLQNATCQVVRDADKASFASSFQFSNLGASIWECSMYASYSTPSRHFFKGRRIDSAPQYTSNELPLVAGVGFDWYFYGISNVIGGRTFAQPASNAGKLLNDFTDDDEFRPVLEGSGNAGDITIANTTYVGATNMTYPADDFGVNCPLSVGIINQGFSLASGAWILDWDFTNK